MKGKLQNTRYTCGVGREKCSTVPASRNFFKQGCDAMLKMDGGGQGGGFHL